MVGQITDRVDRLPGWSGRDDYFLSQQGLRDKVGTYHRNQFERFEQTAGADFATGLVARGRAEQQHTACFQSRQIGLGSRMGIHLLVHCRRHQYRRRRRQHQRGQQIIGKAGSQLGYDIGAGRRDQHQIRPAGQLDMTHCRFGGRIEQIGMDRVAGDGLKGQRSDELARALGHHHPDVGAFIFQPARQLGRLVGRNAAGHGQHDSFALQGRHRWHPCCTHVGHAKLPSGFGAESGMIAETRSQER